MTIPAIFQQWFGKKADPNKHTVVQIIKFIIVLGLLFILLSMIPLSSVVEVIRKTNPLLMTIGIFLGLPNTYLKSVRLGLLTQKQALSISFNKLFKVNMMIKFYLLFLPGGIFGSGLRWAKISSAGNSAETLGAIAFNRIVEFFVVVISGTLFYVASDQKETIDIFILILIGLGLFILFMFLLFATRLLSNLFEKIDRKVINRGFLQQIWDYFDRILKSIKTYTELSLTESLLIFGVSVLSYLAGLLSYVLLARSTGIEISIFDLGWTQAVVFLTAITPISIAGGLGIRDLSLVYMLSLFGVKAEVALAFSLLIFFRGLILSLIGGILELIEITNNRKVLS